MILDFFFSKKCPICLHFQLDSNICGACFMKFSFLNNVCKKCQEPFDFVVTDIDICNKCADKETSYNQMKCALKYNEQVKNLVVRFKNQSDFSLLPHFSRFIINKSAEFLRKDVIIVAVPLYKKRLIWRGYNQSFVLGQYIASQMGMQIYHDILLRVKDTNTQALKNIQERHQNVKDAFALNAKYRAFVKNKKIIVLDDVITTGATVFECANVLNNAGATQVNIIALARRIKNM